MEVVGLVIIVQVSYSSRRSVDDVLCLMHDLVATTAKNARFVANFTAL